MGRIAAIVLAAGASQRFGAHNKLVASIAGVPLVRRVTEVVLGGGVAEVIVVTGCDAALIEGALAGLPVRLVANARWQSGMGSSIAAGVAALRADVEGAFIVPADMPFLSEALLRRLAAAFDEEGGRPIVYPAIADRAQRNPVLWPRRFFTRLAALDGAEGAKAILKELQRDSVAVTVDDAAAVSDIDTAGDLQAANDRASRAR